MSKFLLLILFSFVYANLSTELTLLNSEPDIPEITTYNRYYSPTDNFPLSNFSICNGQTNESVHIRIIARDVNTRGQIDNVSFIVFEMNNGIEQTISIFGNMTKSPTFEQNVSFTEMSYTYFLNLSELNQSTFKIRVNITDTFNDTGWNESFFTLIRTNCSVTEVNFTVLPNETETVEGNFTTINITTNETISGMIIVTEHNESPVDENTSTAVDKYVTVDVVGDLNETAINLSITMSYDDLDITEKELNETTLSLYKWDGEEWVVVNSTISFADNTVTFIIESENLTSSQHLGTFSIRGNPNEQHVSSGGGGGGGGGGSRGGGGGFFFQPAENESNNSGGSGSIIIEEPVDEGDDWIIESPVGVPPPEIEVNESEDVSENITEVNEVISSNICILIIILLLILWIITFLLYINERRKNRPEQTSFLSSSKLTTKWVRK